jgi:hypothetical protein
MQPRRVLLVATSFVLALAVWVSRGALGVADAASWPTRVGILPSRWVPPVLAVVLLATLWRARRSTLLVLLIPGVLLLPWLPIPVPAGALIWTGRAVAWVWIFTALAAGVVAWPRWSGTRIARWLRGPRAGPLTALVVAFTLYCSAAWLLAKVRPGGDLVLSAFAVAEHRGVVASLALLAACGTWLVWRAAYCVTRSAGAAWFGWASVAVSAPFFVQAFAVSPDATGATLVMLGVGALIACEERGDARMVPATTTWGTGRWALLGGAVAVLPWLQIGYAGAAAVLWALLALRLVGRRAYGRLAALAVLPILSAAGWFGRVHAIGGPFGPAAPYAHYTQSPLGGVARGLPALLFDQQFGVLPNAPVYAFGLIGLVSLFRTRRRLAVELALLVVSYLLLVTADSAWWGGSSAPAHSAVPVLLLLGLPAAAFWSRQRAAGKAVALTALGVTVLITASMTAGDSGRLFFNNRDGFSLWLEWLTPVVDLPRAFPSFVRDTMATALAQVAIWVACVGVGAAAVRAMLRRSEAGPENGTAGLALRTLLVFALAVMLAATGTWGLSRVGGTTPTTSALALLRVYDPAARPVGVRFLPFGRLPIDQVPGGLCLPASNRRPVEADGPLLVLFDVPAGVYRLSPTTALAAEGTLVVTIGRSPHPIARWTFDRSSRGGEPGFRLPVGVTALTVSGDALARRTMPRFALEPVFVVPEVWRFTVPRAERAARYDDVVAFAFDPDAWVEGNGTWVPVGIPSSMAFAGPEGAPTVQLLLRNSPVENQVTLRGPSGTDALQLKPGEIRVVNLPVDRMNGGVIVEVTAARGYRPADVDPTTQDRRWLGVWIQNVPK